MEALAVRVFAASFGGASFLPQPRAAGGPGEIDAREQHEQLAVRKRHPTRHNRIDIACRRVSYEPSSLEPFA
jgi:hypothetical protein